MIISLMLFIFIAMMKCSCVSLIVFLNMFCCAVTNAQIDSSKTRQHNKIDDITTSKDVAEFLKSLSPIFSTFHINDSLKFLDTDCMHVSDSLHCTPWFKADFDNNSYPDIVVVGGWDDHAIFCILDSGNNRYAINRLTRKVFQNCTFAVPRKIVNDNVLLYYSLNEPEHGSIKVDTLIYKFGNFVNYHVTSKTYNVEKIELTAHECYGECPQFKLTIDSNRAAEYNAIKYNKTYGDFQGVIDDTSFRQLIQLLNYIDFPNLQNSYSVNWKDDQNCTLTITYDDGKIKTINDDGLHGTFGLERVYQIIYGWRETQQWKKILPGEKRTGSTSE